MAKWTKERWKKEIGEVDQAIRRGKQNLAQTRLRAFVRTGIPREQMAAIAPLTRRASLALIGVRLLNPIVRQPEAELAPASDREKAEYAACLSYIGAAEEASEILASIDDKKLPEALFYRVLALFPQWDYQGSIPLLQRYLDQIEEPYQRLVAMTNLADALVYERSHRQAQPILRTLLHDSGVGGYALVYSRALQISARYYLEKRDWHSAELALQQARERLAEDGLQKFLVGKWIALRDFLAGNAADAAPLNTIRSEAKRIEHWETLRDCDRYQAVATKDRDLLAHVYFGTPFESFRKRLLADFGDEAKLPETYRWHLGGKKGGAEIDLRSALKPGQVLHRLLRCLTSDFYRPFRGPFLHSRLYPGQYFNPASSPLQVRTAINRLRSWFEENEYPLAIDQADGGYRLTASGPCTLLITLDRESETAPLLLSRLHERHQQAHFSAREAAETLGANLRTTQRILQDGLDAGTLERLGSGPATRYHFKI